MKIIITSFKSSLLNPEFDSVNNIEIEDNPIDGGGFGDIFNCISVNGKYPQIPQIIKILKDDDGLNNHLTLQRYIVFIVIDKGKYAG